MLGFRSITRDRLDRQHPLLQRATRLTWFPFDGHRAEMGDVGGAASNSSTVNWDPDPIIGSRFRIESNQTITTGITASQMGISGSNTPWTCIWAHGHFSNLTDSGGFLFTVGDNGNGNNIEANARSTGVRLGNWQQYAAVNPGLQTSPDHTKTVLAVVTYNGLFTIYVRAFNPATNDWEAILSASTPSTNNNLSDAKAFRFADNTSGAGGHSAWTSLGFWGMFAGAAWSADEARDFLLDPEAIWSPRWPIILAQAPAGGANTFNDTLTEGVTAGDGFTGALTAAAGLSEGITAGDAFAAVATMAPARAESVAASDQLGAAATLAPTIAEAVAAADGFAAIGTLATARAEGVTATDSLAAAAVLAPAISDAVTATDGLAALATLAMARAESVAAADSIAVSAVMVAALAESVTAGDSLSDALNGGAQTFNDTIAESVTAEDGLAVVLLGVAPIEAGVVAADALQAALTGAAAVVEGVTAGDGLAAALSVLAVRAEALAAGDGFAAVLGASATLADSVTAADQLGAGLLAVTVLAEAVQALDAYGAGDIGISEARVWRVPLRSRVWAVPARSRVWRVPPRRREG